MPQAVVAQWRSEGAGRSHVNADVFAACARDCRRVFEPDMWAPVNRLAGSSNRADDHHEIGHCSGRRSDRGCVGYALYDTAADAVPCFSFFDRSGWYYTEFERMIAGRNGSAPAPAGETRTGLLGQPGPGMFTTGHRRGRRSLRRGARPQAQLTVVVVRVGDGSGKQEVATLPTKATLVVMVMPGSV